MDERHKGNRVHRIVHVRRRCYPDGGAWLDQEAIVSEAFNIMANEIREVARRG
jgi:hypothetical protein